MLAHIEEKKEFRSYRWHLEIVMKQKYEIRKTTAKNAKTLISILNLKITNPIKQYWMIGDF